jgi:16S rRNA (uracil1498-N3)-methyltransferase
MPRIFLDPGAVREGRVHIEGPDAHHLARALRCRVGEHLIVIAGTQEYTVQLTTVQATAVEGTIVGARPASGEPRLQLTVLQALVRSEDFETVVEYGTQLGVARFVPVITARSVPRWGPSVAAARVARWQAIARSAAELSGRGRIPTIDKPKILEVALTTAPTPIFFLDTHAAPALAGMDFAGETATLCVGPEGGFSDEERVLAARSGAQAVGLGPRTLRARLAAVIAATLLFQRSGDLMP